MGRIGPSRPVVGSTYPRAATRPPISQPEVAPDRGSVAPGPGFPLLSFPVWEFPLWDGVVDEVPWPGPSPDDPPVS